MSFSYAIKILEALKECGTKRKKKEALLEYNAHNPVLKDMFVHTYDWMRTYGIIVEDTKDKEPPDGEVKEETWMDFCNLADNLSNRTLTGAAARTAWNTLMEKCSPKERFWLVKVINRDLKINVGESTVARIWPDALSTFDCQLATDLEKHKPKRVRKGETPQPLYTFPMWVEPKLDGLRILIVVDGDTATIHSREGRLKPGLKHFADAFAETAPGRYVVDGEIFHEQWNKTVSLTNTYPENLDEEELGMIKSLVYYAFDCIPLDDFKEGFSPLPLTKRRAELETLVKKMKDARPELLITTTDVFPVNSFDEIHPLFQRFLEEKIEGAMVKYPNAPYQVGRGTNWLKMKPWITVDAKIIGFDNGKPGSKHEDVLGCFIVETEEGEEVRVGGSMSDKQRIDFWNRREELLGKMLEFKKVDDKAADIVARYPNFVRFRPDKDLS